MTALAVALALSLAQNPPQQPPSGSQPAAPQLPALPPPTPKAQPQGPTPPEMAAFPVLTIEEALQRAASQNLDLQAARARLDQAYQTAWKAWAGYLPQVTGGGTFTHNDVGVSIPFAFGYLLEGTTIVPNPAQTVTLVLQKQDQLGAQIQGTQALFAPPLFFAIPNAYRSQRFAELTLESTRRDILFGVAQGYYGVAALKRTVEVNQRLLEIAQRQEADASIRYKAGTIARVGLLRAQIDRARAEEDLKRAQNSLLASRLGLAVLLDRDPNFDVTDPGEPQLPGETSTLEQRALQDRPEVKASRVAVDIARGNRNTILAGYLPIVGTFGRFQWANVTGFTGKNTAWAVGVALSWNIFDGGLREANLREASARIVEFEKTLASTELRARLDVQQALLDLDSARANAVKAKEQRDLAAENQRLIDVSYRAGAATALELADAATQLRNAELALTAEGLNARLAALRVLRAAGLFDPVPARR